MIPPISVVAVCCCIPTATNWLCYGPDDRVKQVQIQPLLVYRPFEPFDVQLRYIQPDKLNENAFIERFNKTYRVEVLNAYLFRSLDQVREITDEWLRIYNEERPHQSLVRIPPSHFRRQLENANNPSNELSS